ncbi:MAG: transaldolase [Verrucomicrobia bacterium]|nr:transaldolase [Verrucomicrobiota bacterium]
MKIFVDTAEIAEVEQANSWGILDGVTTNPSLLKKAAATQAKVGGPLDIEAYLERIITTAGPGKPVSLEVIGTTYGAMRDEALRLYERFNPVAENVVIKVPVNPTLEPDGGDDADGLRTIAELAGQGIPVNVTLVMNRTQALLAAKAGAAYVSPFAGRIDDFLRTSIGLSFDKGDYFPAEGLPRADGSGVLDDDGVVSGVDLVAGIVHVYSTYGIESEVIAASLRNPRQVAEVAEAGADIATVPFSVLRGLLRHPKTFEGMRSFVADVVEEYRAFFDPGAERT